jgi:pyruvate/2-oxoglutarate dehydrogenase complex dihydrolipoamide dehydrogenase (E3) component
MKVIFYSMYGHVYQIAEAVIGQDSSKLLGFNIIGLHAPIPIQEVSNVMTSGGHVDEIH